MALTIKKAILHILRNGGPPPVYSQAELDIDSDTCETFISKHVKKLINNPATRPALFKPESAVYKTLGGYQRGEVYFKELSVGIAQRLNGILNQFPNLPPCALLVAQIACKGTEYLAIVRLDYQEAYGHETKDADNQLTRYPALPFSGGKVENAAAITLDGSAMPISLTEKPAVLDGGMVHYFSELFLECEANPSKKEQARLIDEVNNEFVSEYCNNNPKTTARIKTALVEESEAEEGFVSIDNVAGRVFDENDGEKTNYITTLREAGIAGDIPLGERVVRQQFGTQRIKGDNGVEVKFPASLAADENALEITSHPDGTVTVVIKRLRIL